jgi:hypothetical protein
MSKRRLISIVAILAIVLISLSCRTPRRGIEVEGEAVKLNVELFGLESTDSGKSEWIYELGGCVDSVNGELKRKNNVEFTVAGISEGMNCQLTVKDISPTAGQNISFLGDDNVMYWANDVALGSDGFGALSARASLQKLYELTGTEVQVQTTPEECNSEGKIYNPETRECEDKVQE